MIYHTGEIEHLNESGFWIIFLFFRYETNTGITRVENYELKNLQQPVIVNFGSYEYTDANGRKVSVQYTADENGFVPHVKILGYSEPQVRGYPGASSALIASLVGWHKTVNSTKRQPFTFDSVFVIFFYYWSM